MRKILFYITYTEWQPTLACELELIQKHRDAGDEVYIVKCGHKLEVCHGSKIQKNFESCLLCQSKLHGVLKRSGVDLTRVLEIEHHPVLDGITLPEFKDVNELMQYTYEGIDIGMAAASSLVSGIRDHRFDPQIHREAVVRNVRTALNVYLFFKDFLSRTQPDLVYFFNGRFAESKPLLRLCQQRQIPFYAHEGGSVFARYHLFYNALPHDLNVSPTLIAKHWNGGDEKERREVAEQWFINRRKGMDREMEQSCIKKQTAGLLPLNFDPTVQNIAIFNTSEDEWVAIDKSVLHSYYRDQNEAIRQIIKSFSGEARMHFYLRVHPNLSNISTRQMDEIKSFSHSNLTVILPNDPVDTYSLIDRCDKVLTFGSTTGVEGSFWGKPSILLGTTFYQGIGAVYEPKSVEAVCDLLRDPNLEVKDPTGALMYGYWEATRGDELTTFRDMANKSGEYADKYGGYDRYGRYYRKVIDKLLRIRYPITYTPFRKQILSYLGRKSTTAFYNGSRESSIKAS